MSHQPLPNPSSPPLNDAITSTSLTAARVKSSASSHGYFVDPYVEHFLLNSSNRRRSEEAAPAIQPMIRRGYAARQITIDAVIRAFLRVTELKKRRQVVILGSGMDTTFLRYLDGSLLCPEGGDGSARSHGRADWYEVDHASVIRHKISAMRCLWTSHLSDRLSKGMLHFVQHDLAAGGLFDALSRAQSFPPDCAGACFDCSCPTLFVAECSFMYLPMESLRDVLSEITRLCTRPSLCVYDPVPGDDAYGRMMVRNLAHARIARRGCAMQFFTDVRSYLSLLADCGWGEHSVGCTMMQAYGTVVPEVCRKVVDAGGRSVVEGGDGMLDELEEWEIIMKHYALIVAEAGLDQSDTKEELCALLPGRTNAIGFQHGYFDVL
mmetsp:Transcript_36182/g.71222  ORF Transcript_36182/g.71222 Transcript_36182/m.71222 type:complete len:379 (+) Transcript_36182:109-1245(+)